jgi:hypothetical protein
MRSKGAPKSRFWLGPLDYDSLLGCVRELHSFQPVE